MDEWRSSVVVVIPAHNEEQSVGDVVRVARMAPFVDGVVVVDNASEDLTASRAHEAGATVIHCREVGKAQAVLAGLSSIRIQPEIIILLDADLRGLKPEHLNRLMSELDAERDMVCGVLSKSRLRRFVLRTRMGAHIPTLTGQRAVKFSAIGHANLGRCKGYALEATLNRAIGSSARGSIPLEGVSHTRREDKVKGMSKVHKLWTRVEVVGTYARLCFWPGRA